MNDNAQPGLGHNRPPEKAIAARLAEERADLLREVAELRSAMENAPSVQSVKDVEACAEIVAMAADLGKRVDKARADDKNPYLNGGREVDEFYRPHLDGIAAIRRGLTESLTAWQRKKAQEEQARRAAEEKRLRDEAEARDKAARKAEEDGRGFHAAQHAQKADDARARAGEAAAAAKAPRADAIQKTTTASGQTLGAKTEWTFEVEDWSAIDLNAIRHFVKRDAVEAALRLAIRQGVHKGVAGVRIYEDIKATVR